MSSINETFSKTSLETLSKLNEATSLALKSTEELFQLNLAYTKKAFEQNSQIASSFFKNPTNPQESSKEVTQWANTQSAQFTEHLQALYKWSEDVQQNTQKLAESQLATAQESLKEQLEALKASAPEQIKPVFERLQTALQTTQQTVASLQNTAKEVQRNVAETVKQTQKATSDAVKNVANKS